MRDDFEGALEEVPAPDQDALSSDEGSEGERLDETMGDAGDQVPPPQLSRSRSRSRLGTEASRHPSKACRQLSTGHGAQGEEVDEKLWGPQDKQEGQAQAADDQRVQVSS